MNTLLLLAALSSQITFNTTQQGDVYTIIPEVTLTQSCLCRVQILSLREGSLNRPGFPGECFICELRLPDHRFRWKH
uniref:curli assembly chaperone CsgC n=1 Tax=Escherichia coli TaxID=562 RepID=UPI00237B8149